MCPQGARSIAGQWDLTGLEPPSFAARLLPYPLDNRPFRPLTSTPLIHIGYRYLNSVDVYGIWVYGRC
jgi:hypothetical protein